MQWPQGSFLCVSSVAINQTHYCILCHLHEHNFLPKIKLFCIELQSKLFSKSAKTLSPKFSNFNDLSLAHISILLVCKTVSTKLLHCSVKMCLCDIIEMLWAHCDDYILLITLKITRNHTNKKLRYKLTISIL